MTEPKTPEEIQGLNEKVDASVEELEEALREYFEPKMPAGIDLNGVEMTTLNYFDAWVSGLDNLRDLEALAESLSADIVRHVDSEGKTNLVVWASVGTLRVRFDLYFWTEEDREAALRQYR